MIRPLGCAVLVLIVACSGSSEKVVPRGPSRVYIAAADGSNPKQLPPVSVEDLFARWSPDGKLLAVSVEQESGDRVTVILDPNARSGSPGTVRGFPAPLQDPVPVSWAPDGKRIAYQSSLHGEPDIFIERFATKGTREARGPLIQNDVPDYDPAWSPDGELIAMARDDIGGDAPRRDIWTVAVKDGRESRLTDGRFSVGSPAWSSDGKRIAFSTNTGDIWLIDVATSKLTRVPTHGSDNDYPAWSPDGKRLAYSTSDPAGSQIVTSKLDGSDRKVISPAGKACVGPDWSPDGDEIVFTCT